MNEKPKILKLEELNGKFVYRVEKGDTLHSVANKFHTTPQLLIDINFLTEEPLEGEFLVVERLDGDAYTVRPGDDLFSICGGDEKTVEAVKLKNHTDFVFVGMKIVV